jgi:hypothetical protein
MTLEPRIVAQRDLPQAVREEMLALHSQHFERVQRDRFMADLAEKDWVILLRNADGEVAGFSTQKLLEPLTEHGSARCLFSGDTIVEPTYWNTPFLAGCFGHLMLRLIEQYGEESLYWFLISKGFRTYRFLPVFFHRFWPGPGREVPAEIRGMLDAAATRKFGAAFDAAHGIVRVAGSDRLGASLAEIPAERRRDPHVAFFVARNPGYVYGDELACLAPIRRDNLNAYAQRVIRSTHPVWQC